MAFGLRLEVQVTRAVRRPWFSEGDYLQGYGAEVAGRVGEADALAVFEPGGNAGEEAKGIAFFHIEHPARLHEEPAFLVGIVGAGVAVGFPEGIGFPVGQAGEAVVEGGQETPSLHRAGGGPLRVGL